ncbi:MAG: hypothetical protein AAFV32_06295 [Myxococcota bacterium]
MTLSQELMNRGWTEQDHLIVAPGGSMWFDLSVWPSSAEAFLEDMLHRKERLLRWRDNGGKLEPETLADVESAISAARVVLG